MRLDDEESIEQFCSEDPFAKAGIQSYRIVQFNLYQIQKYAEEWR